MFGKIWAWIKSMATKAFEIVKNFLTEEKVNEETGEVSIVAKSSTKYVLGLALYILAVSILPVVVVRVVVLSVVIFVAYVMFKYAK